MEKPIVSRACVDVRELCEVYYLPFSSKQYELAQYEGKTDNEEVEIRIWDFS